MKKGVEVKNELIKKDGEKMKNDSKILEKDLFKIIDD